MKVLFVSNAPIVPSGYGIQTRLFMQHMKPLGYDVAVAANYGLEGYPLEAGDFKIYPSGRRMPTRDDVVWAAAEKFDPDVTISLYDPWALRFLTDPGWGERRWIAWATIDSSPLDFLSKQRLMEHADGIVAYSKFGHQVLLREGFEASYIPLGIDTQFYTPGDRSKARASVPGLTDDVFLVSMVGRNNTAPSRKGYPQAIQAFKRFNSILPNTALYLHTTDDEWEGGLNLRSLVEEMQVPNVYWCDRAQYRIGFPEEYMRQVYQATDVLLNPSRKEGFGLPIVEAEACGTPVIACHNSSMTELVRSAGGWLVGGQADWGPHRSWEKEPSVQGIVQALVSAYRSWQDDEEWGRRRLAARRFAEGYDFSRTAQMWDGFLRRF